MDQKVIKLAITFTLDQQFYITNKCEYIPWPIKSQPIIHWRLSDSSGLSEFLGDFQEIFNFCSDFFSAEIFYILYHLLHHLLDKIAQIATLPWMSCLFNFRLIVDACTFTPDAAREVCNSLEVMCGLAFTWFIILLVLLGDGLDGRPLLGRVAVMLNALHL